MKKDLFYDLGKSILPENIRVKIRAYLSKTGAYEVPFSLYGKVFVLSMLLTIIAYFLFVLPKIQSSNTFFLIISSFIMLTIVEFIFIALLFFSFWTHYEFVIFRRTLRIEEVLPDFLEEVSTNLRAGMSFDKALWNSVEPEFDVLEREIEIVAKKVMAGEDTEKALKDFADKYNSTLLQESMDMIIIGLKSGGNISDLIDRIVDNVKQASYLRKELIASVTSFIIFIAAVAVVISPILFALSFNLMQIIQGLGEKLTSGSNLSLPFKVGAKSINPEDFILFSKIAVIIISSVASIIIADLREGSIKAGIKYLFIFIPSAFIIYIVSLQLFTGVFGVLV
jgi:pilus assembly protein TadC